MSRYISMMVMLCGILLAVPTGCSGGGSSAEPVATTRWQQVNAPEGGIINDLAVDPANHLTLYAATNNSGVFKSTDGGASWRPANSGVAWMQVYCIAVDPNNSQTIYIGTDSGVYKSTNAAASWSAANSGLYQVQPFPDAVLSISIDPTDSRNIFAGCGGGIYTSSDAGASWSRVYSGVAIPSVAVAPGNGQVVYAGTSSLYVSDSGITADDLGVLKSSDGGRTWQTVYKEARHVRSILIDSTNSNIVYVSADNAFFRSSDGGGSWDIVYGSATNNAASAPGNLTIYALVSDSLTSSTDGGVHWNQLSTPLFGTEALSLVVDPADSQTIYVGTYGAGVFKSIDGGVSWSAVNTGLTATAINAAVIAGDEGTQSIFVGTQSGIFRSTDAGNSWSMDRQIAFVTSLAIDPRNAQTMYAGRDFGGVYKSDDGGESWGAANDGLTLHLSDTLFVYPTTLAFDQGDGTLYAGTNKGVYKSSNAGGSWSAAGASLASHILTVAINPVRDGVVYAGTHGGVYKSVDGGASWMAVNAGLKSWEVIYSLVIDPFDTQTLYAGTSSGVYKSTDGGNFWSATTTTRTATFRVTVLAIDPLTRTLYAGTRGALYSTTDGGSSWNLVNIPVANTEDITAIAVKGTRLCAVTNGGAVFIGTTTRQ